MPQQASAFPREEYIYYPNAKYGMRLLRGGWITPRNEKKCMDTANPELGRLYVLAADGLATHFKKLM